MSEAGRAAQRCLRGAGPGKFLPNNKARDLTAAQAASATRFDHATPPARATDCRVARRVQPCVAVVLSLAPPGSPATRGRPVIAG